MTLMDLHVSIFFAPRQTVLTSVGGFRSSTSVMRDRNKTLIIHTYVFTSSLYLIRVISC